MWEEEEGVVGEGVEEEGSGGGLVDDFLVRFRLRGRVFVGNCLLLLFLLLLEYVAPPLGFRIICIICSVRVFVD